MGGFFPSEMALISKVSKNVLGPRPEFIVEGAL